MFNCHIHTRFSSDCDMDIKEAIDISKKTGIGIIVTDHMDLGLYDDGRFTFNVDEFFKEYKEYRSERLLLGIEIGMRNDYERENRKIAEDYSFDYVLGSVHVVNGYDIFYDEYYAEKNKKMAYEEYFDCMLKCLKTYDFIDCLGHIDYIARYGRYEDKEIYYDEYREYIDEVLSIAAKKGISIEVNTRRLNDREAYLNLLKIYKRFKELGGETATIGSDSHRALDIQKGLKEACEIIKAAYLTPVYYKERKAVEYKI